MSDLFRNHIVGFPMKWLIYSLHHKQLKISFVLTDFYFAGVSNKPCLLPILVVMEVLYVHGAEVFAETK